MNHDTLRVVYFYFCATFTVVGAISTVLSRNPIRGAMGLLLTIGGIAALFLSLHAEFLAATQLIVYAGAVVVLFLFAIMLLGPAALPPHDNETWGVRLLGAIGALVVGAGGIISILAGDGSGKPWVFPVIQGGEGSIESIAKELFGPGIVPFEISSALLIVAIIGAVAVARGRQGDPAKHVGGKLKAGISPSDPSAPPVVHGAAE